MDDRANRRTAPSFGINRRGPCHISGELNHDAKVTHCPMRIGGSTRVTAVRSNRTEDREQGQDSKTSGRSSSSKPLPQKSVPAVSKLSSSSSSSLRKARRMQQSSVTAGQSSSTRNISAGLVQVEEGGPAFHKGIEDGPNSSSRLGLAEISNLTSSEASNSNFHHVEETPISSTSRSLFRSNSSVERRQQRMLSGRFLNRQGSWNDSGLQNVNNKLSDLLSEGEQQHVWMGKEENRIRNLGAGASTSSLGSGLIIDAVNRSAIFGTGDQDTTSDDSFVTVASMAGDPFDMDVAASSNSMLQCSPLVNQRTQEQGSLTREFTGHVDKSPVSLGEVMNMSRPSTSKRKPSTPRTANLVAGKSSSQDITAGFGFGSKERHAGRLFAGSASRRNLGNYGCTSASDALPSNFSSFNVQDSDHSGNRRPNLVRRIIDGQDSARGRRLAKVSASSNTGSAVSQRTIRSGAGIAPHQNSKANLPPQFSRRTVRTMQPDTWCSRGLLGGDAVVESRLPSESSSSSMLATDQNTVLGTRPRGPSPPSFRGRSAIGTLQRRNDISLRAACTLGERAANQFVGSTSRSSSSSAVDGRMFGSSGSASRLNRTCTDSDSSTHSLLSEDEISLLSEDEIGNNASIISGPAPSRPPPLPPVVQACRVQTNAIMSASLSFPGPPPPRPPPSPVSASLASVVETSTSSYFDGSVFGRATSGSDTSTEGLISHSEGRHRAFRTLSTESENHSRLTMEGLAEVLLALERIEQDEELTYEQVLMLEANLLFGGISLHDQHSDMRLDIDNMSYEELLALEERMGNVSTGLSEDTVSKCLTRIPYSSDVAVASNLLESEVKCSVCQEEYEERDELGRLNCDHSYHAACIKQWLLQKNQCPICKAPASV